MGYRKIRYTQLNYDGEIGTNPFIASSDVLLLEWQTGPTITGTWPGSAPSAPTTAFELNGPAFRVETKVGWFNVADGTITIELLVGGVTVDSAIVGASGTGEVTLKSGEIEGGSAGASVAVRFTNGTSGDMRVSDSGAEDLLYLQGEEFWPDVLVPETDLCDELYVTLPNVPQLKSWVSSDQSPINTYPTIGQPYALSFDSSHNWYVAESLSPDYAGPWMADTEYCIGSAIIADGKLFAVTAASGAMYPCGFLGGSEPTWPGAGTVVDGGVTWSYVRAAVHPDDDGMFNIWSDYGPGAEACIGSQLLGGDDNIYEITAADGVPIDGCGMSGGSEPTWPGSGDVGDGGLTWTFQHTAYVGDPKNLIEKFNSDGTSAGELGPDLLALNVQPGTPMGIRVAADVIWLLAYLNDSTTLKLFEIDLGGTLVDSWTVAHDDYGFGTALDLDIATDGKAYYVQEYSLNGDGNAELRCFDPVAVVQKPSLLVADQVVGAFRLLLGTQGGAAIVRPHVDPETFASENFVDLYDKSAVFLGQFPIGNMANAMCFGETANMLWVGDFGTALGKWDLRTFVPQVSIDPADTHNDIVSCTTELGDGFVFAASGRRRGGQPLFVY